MAAVLTRSAALGSIRPDDKLTPANARDIADTLASGLLSEGRRRVSQAEELLARIVAKRLVKHLEPAGFVVMKRLPD
jgi:hypothetical protein